MEMRLRRAEPADRERVILLESRSTPGLRYVEHVWDLFLGDRTGDWSVVEMDGEIAGCGKYTILPDGSAWLETLRVMPERQRLGVGKRLYEHWLELARRQGVRALRMYTGMGNKASKGLAERYGFTLAGVFHEARRPSVGMPTGARPEFRRVIDGEEAEGLLMPLQSAWTGFLIMNRTYYAYSPALCRHLAERGMVYHDPATRSVVVLGARFMPGDALHIGAVAGDLGAGLAFAAATAAERGAARLNIQFPPAARDIRDVLSGQGFDIGRGDFIVMEFRDRADAVT